MIPDPRELKLIEKGEKALGMKKKIRGKIEISKMTNREDNMMYQFTT